MSTVLKQMFGTSHAKIPTSRLKVEAGAHKHSEVAAAMFEIRIQLFKLKSFVHALLLGAHDPRASVRKDVAQYVGL